ncbi:MAG TPA: hypothetical protein VJV78_38845 [Polyangiales bacterium]|nr:hypothetical protein [Polyangiales bacterium]
MRFAALSLLLISCGPVMLGHEQAVRDAGLREVDGASPFDASIANDPNVPPSVFVGIKSSECGKCFELQANAAGGKPPYDFEWEDGSLRAQRHECVEGADVVLSVVARDAKGARSTPHVITLEGVTDAGCSAPMVVPPPPPGPAAKLCLMNPSFDGTPQVNIGPEELFDAKPWSTCTFPPSSNSPEIGNDMIAQTVDVPAPTEGLTFLGMTEGEQVSQALCSQVPDNEPLSLELDLARININAGLAPETEAIFLEIWGGLVVNCSQSELLWASPALKTGWQHFCVTLRPRAFMTQLTLRASSDGSLPSPAYMLVDNLKPVERCP